MEYKIFHDVNEWGEGYFTEFYEGLNIIKRKKYWLFGEVITETEPNLLFTLDFSIESAFYTKGKVRRIIEEKLELMGRKEELKRGEII